MSIHQLIRVSVGLCVVLGTFFTVPLKAQPHTMDSSSLFAISEITNMQLATGAYDNQKFDMVFISTQGSVSDTSTGTFSIQGDNFRSTFDSVEQIQNNFMNLEIHADGKILVVSNPTPFNKQFFKGNIDESMFQRMNVNTVSLTTVGTNKKVSFNFLPESEFLSYDIIYNPATYRVSDITIQNKTSDSLGNYSPTVFLTSHIILQNFQTIAAGSVSFETSPYIYFGTGNTIFKQPAFNDYQVVNLMDGQ